MLLKTSYKIPCSALMRLLMQIYGDARVDARKALFCVLQGAMLERVSSPLRTHSIDLDNVRSNLSKGAGGALSPVLLSPAAPGGPEVFPESGAGMRSLLNNGKKEPSETERILERLERTRNWAAQVPEAVGADGRPAQQSSAAAADAADAKQDKPNAQPGRVGAEVCFLKPGLSRRSTTPELLRVMLTLHQVRPTGYA